MGGIKVGIEGDRILTSDQYRKNIFLRNKFYLKKTCPLVESLLGRRSRAVAAQVALGVLAHVVDVAADLKTSS